MAKMQSLNWPQSAIELARGEMGMPHRGFPKDMQDAVLKGKLQPMVGRPGDTLEPEDFAKVKAAMEEEFKKPATDEDVQAFLMYPAVFRGYMKHVDKVGPLATYLPTSAFFYGLMPGEKLEFEVPGDSVTDAEAKADHELPLKKVAIQLSRVGPVEHEDIRTVEWIVDGQKYVTKLVDPSSGKVKYAGPMADAKNKAHIPCPLPGAVAKVDIADGQELKKDQPMFTVAAMKMEVVVKAPADCTVVEVCVAKDADVVDGALLAKIKF
jgi:pyruvate carboxylase